MPIEINPFNTQQIFLINELIREYRVGLTTGQMNENGGYPVSPAVLATTAVAPGRIRVTYQGNELDVVHVAGQICGFITHPGAQEKFLFLNHAGGDALNVTAIEDWYTGAYGGNVDKISRYPIDQH